VSTHVFPDIGHPIIVVCGVAGGVGVTSLAAWLTRTYARRGSAVGVDLDLWTGDLAERMGLRDQPTTTIADIAAVPAHALHASHVRTVVWGNPDQGGEVVPSPAHPELAEIIPASHVACLLAELRVQSTVIVDAGSRCDERTLAACTMASAIVMCSRSRADLERRAARSFRDTLERAGIDTQRIYGSRSRRASLVTNLRVWTWLRTVCPSTSAAPAPLLHRNAWEGAQ
jgi:MinD-like ATPase involved in chromosome partitioning or flagellar assembly